MLEDTPACRMPLDQTCMKPGADLGGTLPYGKLLQFVLVLELLVGRKSFGSK